MRNASVLVLFLLLPAAGCSSPAAAPPVQTASSSGSEAPLVPPGEAGVGDRTTCLVSNEEFVVTADSPHAEHEGRTYYFCCPPCVARFQANPDQYLAH